MIENKQVRLKKIGVVVIYAASIVTILALAWMFCEIAWTLHAARNKSDEIIDRLANSQSVRNLEDSTANLQATSALTQATVEHLHNSALALLTQDFIDDTHNYANRQAASVLAASNNSRKLTNNLNELVKELSPKIGNNLDRSEKVLAGFESLAQEIQHQTKQNGDSAKGAIDETTNAIKAIKSFTVDSEQEVLALLKETTATMHGVQVITNDPELAKAIKNSNLILANSAVITESFAKVTHDFAFGTPPKNKFDKFFVRPLKYTVQFFAGTGNLIVLANKF